MKQAILITAYKNFEHLIDIATCFDDRFEVYIHIDKKSVYPVVLINLLNEIPQVKLVSQKYKVNWGGINHLKCILHLANEAVKNQGIERFHLISGHDYPVKDGNHFMNFFKKNKESNFINYNALPFEKWPYGGLDRLEYYNFYDLLDAKKYRPKIFKLVHWQKQLHIKRAISNKVPKLYGGETWWSLSRDALVYVLEYTKNKPYFLKRLRHSFCSEEIYVQSVIMNSPYAATVVNDSLRYIDWSSRNGNFPANLDLTDLDPILTSNKLFARKFEFPGSQPLKLKIMEHLGQH